MHITIFARFNIFVLGPTKVMRPAGQLYRPARRALEQPAELKGAQTCSVPYVHVLHRH